MAVLTEFKFFSNSWLWFGYFGLWRISRWSQNCCRFSIKYFLFKPNLFSNMGQTCLWYPFVKVDYVSVDIKIIAVPSVFYHLDAHNLCFYIDLWRTYRAIAFALNKLSDVSIFSHTSIGHCVCGSKYSLYRRKYCHLFELFCYLVGISNQKLTLGWRKLALKVLTVNIYYDESFPPPPVWRCFQF